MPSHRDKRTRATRRGLIAVAIAVVALLAASGPALGAQDELKGGSVVIQLHGSRGLKLKPSSLNLQVTGGAVDPIDGSGTVQVSGAIKARRGRGKAKVTILSLTFGANGGQGSIAAKVGKKKIGAFGTLAGGTVARSGWGATISNVAATLAGKGARALNRAFSPKGHKRAKSSARRALKAGQPLGTVISVTTDPKTVEVVPGSGTMTLATDPGLITTLLAHCIDALPIASPAGVSPIAPATEGLTGTFTFPVSGGFIAPDLSDGRLITVGGQAIAKNNTLLVTVPYPSCATAQPPVGTSVTQTDFEIEFALNALSASAVLPTGPFGLAALGDLHLDEGTTSVDPETKQVTISGVPVTVSFLAAQVLNSVFPNQSGSASNDFFPGEALGTLGLTATLR